ncbi:MAG: NAD-dependent deacylase [Vicinamibacterales bacterium]
MERLIERLRGATRVTVLTGAGVSAASGVPTFRGAAGMWKQFRPEQLATPEAFARDPKTAWEWYDWRRQQISKAEPNDAHRVLARWASRFPAFTLITQNVDGLHERAGSKGLLRYHGSIWHMQCAARCNGAGNGWEDRQAPLPVLPPACPHCGALARPGVVWFGEAIPPEVHRAASQAASSSDVFIAAGTSSVVYPAAGLIHEAARHGAFIAEINIEMTEASSSVDAAITGPAEVVLSELELKI